MSYLSPNQSAEKRSERADLAEQQFGAAAKLAAEHGFTLRRCTPIQYQLWPAGKKWLINIHPSNRRIYHDPNKRGPYLDVPACWTLLDVVKAAVKAPKL